MSGFSLAKVSTPMSRECIWRRESSILLCSRAVVLKSAASLLRQEAPLSQSSPTAAMLGRSALLHQVPMLCGGPTVAYNSAGVEGVGASGWCRMTVWRKCIMVIPMCTDGANRFWSEKIIWMRLPSSIRVSRGKLRRLSSYILGF